MTPSNNPKHHKKRLAGGPRFAFVGAHFPISRLVGGARKKMASEKGRFRKRQEKNMGVWSFILSYGVFYIQFPATLPLKFLPLGNKNDEMMTPLQVPFKWASLLTARYGSSG